MASVLAVITAVAGLVGVAEVSRPGVLAALGLLGTSLAVSWAASVAGAPQRPLLVLQIAADTVALGLLVHFTGGPYSAIPLAFCVPIMFAAYYLDRRWALAIAGTAATLVGGGHFGLALGWLASGGQPGLDFHSGWPVLITALHMSLFVVVGMISGDLSERLERRRREHARSQRQAEQARREVRDILDCLRSGLLTVDTRGRTRRAKPGRWRDVGCGAPQLAAHPAASLREWGDDLRGDTLCAGV